MRCAVLKGRQNYLCRRSLHGLELLGGSAGALFRSPEDARDFELLRDWIETTESGDRAELAFEPRPTLWSELAVGPDRCAGRRCPFLATCFSELARERAGEAELVIANHALYFADLAVRGRSDGPGILPDHDAVVFDEAHRLEDAAAGWFGGRLSLAGVRQLLRDVERTCRERGRAVPARALAEIDRSAEELLGGLDPGRGRRRLTEADIEAALEPASALAAAFEQLAASLRGAGEDEDALARRSLGRRRPPGRLSRPSTTRTPSPGPSTTRSRGRPVDLSGFLREALWERDATAILVSATLEPRFLRRRLGIDDAREVTLASPFDFQEQALLYVPSAFPEPRSPGYEARLADEVVSLCRLSEGRALVLTSSYRALDELWDRAAAAHSVPGHASGGGPAGAPARTLPGRGGLGALRDGDVLAGGRRPRESRSRSSSSTSCPLPHPATLWSRRAANGSPARAGTGSRTTRFRLPCCSCVRGSGVSSGVTATGGWSRSSTQGSEPVPTGAVFWRRSRRPESSPIPGPWPTSTATGCAQPADTFGPVAKKKKSRVPTPPKTAAKRPVQAPKAYHATRDPRRTRMLFIAVGAVILLAGAGVGIAMAVGRGGSGAIEESKVCELQTFESAGRNHVTSARRRLRTTRSRRPAARTSRSRARP